MKYNFKKWFLAVVVLFVPFLVAFQIGDGEGVELSEVQLAILVNILLPIVAQVVKVYREKGGEKPSAAVINWSIFAVGVIMTAIWGGASGYFTGLEWPVIDWSDPGLMLVSIFGFFNSVMIAGGKVLGVAVAYYMLLKPLVFKYIPWLQTEKLKEEAARS